MVTVAQRSFTAGEITPSLYPRVDLARYSTGLRTCRNFFVMKHGGAANRPGTKYITEVKTSTEKVRLIPFVFNSDQTYVLEFGDQYIRFIKDGAQLESGGSPYEIATPYLEAELPELRYTQSADVVTITHPNHKPRELARTGDTSWTLTEITFGTVFDRPTFLGAFVSGGGGAPSNTLPTISYQVTAVSRDGEESYPRNSNEFQIDPNVSDYKLWWDEVTDANYYKIYRIVKAPVSGNGAFDVTGGFIGATTGTNFFDGGIAAELETAPEDLDLFNAADDYPTAVMYNQNALFFGNSNNNPETIWKSRIGSYGNFDRRFPVLDDDSIQFNLVGRKVSRVLHMVQLDKLIVFTSEAEWIVAGNDAGVITPTNINARQQTENGSGSLRPIVVNGTVIYVQSQASIVRDFLFDFELESYRGNDLTIYSSHLVQSKTIVDWDYQQTPNSIIWMARSDGTLLGLTYIREESMLAWHRHDFENGLVENVITIPGSTEDDVYLLIKRTIDGATKRYIEKMEMREFSDIEDAIFMDSAITGTEDLDNDPALTISGGTDYTADETLTLTADTSSFESGDVGKEIVVLDAGVTQVRLKIISFTSDTVVSVRSDRTVPSAYRETSIAVGNYAVAFSTITGLDHLEGEQVSILGDGKVVASPNNTNYDTVTVSGGSVTVSANYVKFQVGLPITSDLETLNIDTAQGVTTANKKHLVSELQMFVESSRGIYAGTTLPSGDGISGLREYRISNQDASDDPPDLVTDWIKIYIRSKWTNNGRIAIRQVDPLPLKVLAVVPTGYIPIGGN